MTDIDSTNSREPSMAFQESFKLLYDLFKHITTLSTGTIIVLATFLEKLFPNPIWMPLVIVTFVGLIVSLVSALCAMPYMALHVRETISRQMGLRVLKIVVICYLGFLVAILSLTIFSIRNFLA